MSCGYFGSPGIRHIALEIEMLCGPAAPGPTTERDPAWQRYNNDLVGVIEPEIVPQ